MRKTIFIILIFTVLTLCLSAQSEGSRKEILYIHEESNENIDPWKDMFESVITENNFKLTTKTASDLDSTNLDSYDYIIIHASVMAFTFKEPIRDWLKTYPDLSDNSVVLFVTANRWFSGKIYEPDKRSSN